MESNPGFTIQRMRNHTEPDDVYDYGYNLRNSLKLI